MHRTLTLAAPLVGLALALSACGGDAQTAAPATQATVQGISTEYNDADAAFIKDMTPHHSSAVAMARLAPTQAADAQVKAIAARIMAAQEPEIARMKSMSEAWKVDMGAAGGHDMGSMGSGAGSDDEAVLKRLQGAAFDKEFLTRMIAHHSSAVDMAQVELDKGKNPQAKELAGQIIKAQQAEIAEMTALQAKV